MYPFEQPRQDSPNEHPQSMLCARIGNIMYMPVNPSFLYRKWGLAWCLIHGLVHVMFVTLLDNFRGLFPVKSLFLDVFHNFNKSV